MLKKFLQWTWADFAVSLFVSGLIQKADNPDIAAKLPGLAALAKSVEEIPQIAAWIAKRPDTPM